MENLCDNLRREVLSYIPTKAIKITDAFVEWCKDYKHWEKKSLGLEIYNVIEGNIFTTVREKNEFSFGGNFVFGQIDGMRKDWFEFNESHVRSMRLFLIK